MLRIDKTTNFERKTTRNGMPLYFCRCEGDGSWLIDASLNSDKGAVFSMTPKNPAKVTLDEAERAGISGGPYSLTSVALTDANRVALALERHPGPQSYETLWRAFKKSSPFGFRFQWCELAVILNHLVRVGIAEIDPNGLGFKRADSKEARELREALADGWKALRGDSNDAEHDALVAIIEALTGEEV
jgi:hypothetical protein